MRDFWCNSMSYFLSIHPYIFLFVRVSLANETFSFGSFEVLLQLTPCRLSLYGEFKNYVKFILLFFLRKKTLVFVGWSFHVLIYLCCLPHIYHIIMSYLIKQNLSFFLSEMSKKRKASCNEVSFVRCVNLSHLTQFLWQAVVFSFFWNKFENMHVCFAAKLLREETDIYEWREW